MANATNLSANILSSQPRAETLQRLFRLFTAGALSGALICALLYLRTGVWQNLAVAISFLFALLIAGASLYLGKIHKKKTASSTALLAVLIGYAFPLLFWANATGYFLVGGGLVFLIIASILIGKWRFRIVGLLIFVICTLTASEIPIFPRYDIQSSPVLSVLLPLITALICIGAFWQFVRTLRVNTIRTRLLISFILIAVLPLLIAAITASSIGSQATTKSSVDLLTAVITFKENLLRSWIADLQQNLHNVNSADKRLPEMLVNLNNPPDNARYKIAYRNLSDQFNGVIEKRGEFRELLLLNPEGTVQLSTDPTDQGLDLSGEKFYISGIYSPSMIPPAYLSLIGEVGVAVAEPVIDIYGTTVGVLVGLTDLKPINEIMLKRQGVGQTGETYLVAENLNMLTPSIKPEFSGEQTQVVSQGSMDSVLGRRNGSGVYENYAGEPVVGVYHWMPDLNLSIMAEQTRAEIFAPTYKTIVINTAISFAMIIGTVIFAVLITNSIANPLAELTKSAQRIAAGELDINAPVGNRKDEITDLAISFNRMTEELRKLIFRLEQRVAERTLQLERRTEQLQAASNLGSTVTMILDLEDLIHNAVNLIQERFELHFVGLFLLDENRESAELKAGAGSVSQVMLIRPQKVRLGEEMVGQCILNSQVRVLQESEKTQSITMNMPETMSEAALPLRSRGQVLGALNIHSTQARAFDEATLSIFQNMADFIAVAIDNARLLTATQKALETTRQAYGELGRKAWLERLTTKPIRVRRNVHGLSVTASKELNPETHQSKVGNKSNGTVEIPIKVRNQEIGVIHAQKHQVSGEWNIDEQEMLSTLTYQLGIALESARLFEETLMRAERERLIGDISNRIRETLEIETVLKTAVKEMREALDLDEVEVRLSKG